MKKIFLSVVYMVLHPIRAVKIMGLYRFLNGSYRFTIILAHSYKEAVYRKNNIAKNNFINVSNLRDKNIFDNQQVVINIHDGLLHSGGLTDRLKGICTLYMFAKKANYKFKVCFVSPFHLEKYLLPNEYNWTIDEKEITYDLKKTAIYTWENEKLAGNFFRSSRTKLQLHISCNSAECFPDYSVLFHELFKPSSFLSTAIEFHSQKLGGYGNYISISLRFQNLLGEFEEGNSTPLNREKRQILIEKCLHTISEIKKQFPDAEKFLITSDSNIFREIASNKRSYVYTYILPEETGHIDYAESGKAKELTAFLDMFLIARGKKAYQIRSTEMYNSDFPKMAAKINNVPYEMILIN